MELEIKIRPPQTLQNFSYSCKAWFSRFLKFHDKRKIGRKSRFHYNARKLLYKVNGKPREQIKSHPVDARGSKEEISSIRRTVHGNPPPFIYHIDNSRGRSPQRRSQHSFVEAHVCTPFFRVCNLSSFHEKEKEMSVFSSSLVTCAPELCMPPLTSNMLFEYISGPVIQPVYALPPPPLFIATRLSNPRKRSWIIISRLSTRERYGERICLVWEIFTDLRLSVGEEDQDRSF